jgi:hypothetical protein
MAEEDTDTGGTFFGHVLAGTPHLVFGLYYLRLTWVRFRSLPSSGKSFCQTYIPEKNKTLMVRVSWAMMPLLLAGILSEGVPSCIWSQYAKDHPPQNNILCFFHQSFHEMVYLMHGGIAVVAILETKQLLPPDSWRATFALVSFFASLMWEDHATMKHNPTEAAMHHFVAVTCLLQAACLTCSVLRPDHIPVYVACWACSILRGLWFWTARLCYAPFMTQQIPVHKVCTLFTLEAMLIAFSIVMGVALFHHQKDPPSSPPCASTEERREDELAELL